VLDDIDGGQARDFIYVRDIARCNVLALTNLEASHGAFNVCSGNPKTVLDKALALQPRPSSNRPRLRSQGQL
jgi:dTDP-L-rhamnose 4-epimerase